MKKMIYLVSVVSVLLNACQSKKDIKKPGLDTITQKQNIPSLLKYIFDELDPNLRKGIDEFESQGVKMVRFGKQKISQVEWEDITRKLTDTNYPQGFDIWTVFSKTQKKFLIDILRERGTDIKVYDDWLKECTEALSKSVGEHVTEAEFLDLVNDHLRVNMLPNNAQATYIDALNDLFPGNTFHFDLTQQIVQSRYILSRSNPESFVDKMPVPKGNRTVQ